MTETQLLHAIEAVCDELGLLHHHCRDSRSCTGHKGFPDLLILGPGGLLLAELKSAAGETTAEQDLWLWQLRYSPGSPGRLWGPADFPGTVRAELERIAGKWAFAK